MTRLYLVRHGIAVPHGDPDYPEEERPLTEEGARRMQQVGKGLRRLGVKVDRLVTSPLPRAFQTAEIVADALGMADLLETEEALRADRSAASIRAWIAAQPDDRLMIFGHNPAFSDLVGLLLTGDHSLPTVELRKGAVAAFLGGPDGALHLDWIARPKLLRRR